MWLGSGELGFKVMPRALTLQGKEGVLISEIIDDEVPLDIKAGMLLECINGVRVDNLTFKETLSTLREAQRPLSIRFRSTVEHAVLEELVAQFLEADKDNSGALNLMELSTVLRNVHRMEGLLRNIKTIERECQKVMEEYDLNGDDMIDFNEFINMMTG